MFPEGQPSFSLEIDRGRVEEDDVECRQEVSPPREQALFHPIFRAPGGKRGPPLLLRLRKLRSQPSHGAIELVELEGLGPRKRVARLPLARRPIRARPDQPVHHRQEQGALYRKAKPSAPKQPLQLRFAPRLLPKPPEDQPGADARRGDLGRLSPLMRRQDQHRLGEPRPRAQEAVELAGGVQGIQASQRCHHRLFDPSSTVCF